MSRYIYTLHDYHAIKKAFIIIDGITVLSGENGSGKSTLSKWLYYLVNGVANFDEYVYNAFINDVQGKVRQLDMLRRDIERFDKNGNAVFFHDGNVKLRRLSENESPENVDTAVSIFKSVLAKFVDILTGYLKNAPSPAVKERILKYLNIEIRDEESIDDDLDYFVIQQERQMQDLFDKYQKDKNERSKERFFSLLQRNFRIRDKQPVNIQLEEDGVKLFKKNVTGNLFNLKGAIYIDTPMAISEDVAYDNVFWDNLQDLMIYPVNNVTLPVEAMKIIRRIGQHIKGKVTIKKDSFNQDELHYVREDGLDIKLDDVATGFKSFSYIQRLIENGYLDDSTLLMIDEPEAHLHPQFIVEFARLLVLLNKYLGVKVMIASHNPDMVAAIQSIAKKENMADITRFYIAEKADAYTYLYRDLGNNIEDIFKSFNIAYERIEQYGDNSI